MFLEKKIAWVWIFLNKKTDNVWGFFSSFFCYERIGHFCIFWAWWAL
jgi:hypothetical protein